MQKLKSVFPAGEVGLSVLEMLIAVGISAVISLAVVQMLSNQAEGERRLWQAMNLSNMHQLIQATLMDQTGCRNTLVPGTPIAMPVDSPYDEANPNSYTALDVIKDVDNLDIIKTVAAGGSGTFPKDAAQNAAGTLTDIKIRFSLSINATHGLGVAERAFVRVIYNKTVSRSLTPATSYREFSVLVLPDAAGAAANILDCWGITQYADAVCHSFGGILNTGTGKCERVRVPGRLCIGPPGAPLCITSWETTPCAPGKRLRGVNPDNSPVCEP